MPSTLKIKADIWYFLFFIKLLRRTDAVCHRTAFY